MLSTKFNTPEEIFSSLKVTPTIDGNYQLLEDFKVNNITVPKGYKTNGANIPRMLWSFVPPFKVQNLPAVVVHDWLCDIEDYITADLQFKVLLNHFNMEKYKSILVTSVKVYHKIKYNIPFKSKEVIK